MRKFILLVALLFLCSASAASAAMFTQTLTFDSTLSFDGVGAGDPGILTFDQYSGTEALTGIKIEFGIDVDGGNILVDNDGPDEATGTAYMNLSGGVTSTDVSLMNISNAPVNFTYTDSQSRSYDLAANEGAGDDDEDIDPSEPDGELYEDILDFSYSDSDYLSSSVWSQFMGTGTYDILVAALSQITIIGDTISYGQNPPSASGSVTITYYTSAVPVPAAIWLFGSGILGLVGLRKKRF